MLTLTRDDQNTDRTFGVLADGDTILAQTLELPWRNNAHDVSCIPVGEYRCELQWSPKHNKSLYWILDVPDRGDVEIHVGNTVADTLGCVLVGQDREGDGVTRSRVTFAEFMQHMNGVSDFTLLISGGAQ